MLNRLIYVIFAGDAARQDQIRPAGEGDARATLRGVLGTSIFNESGSEQNCFYELQRQSSYLE